jgi:hypothetical protein
MITDSSSVGTQGIRCLLGAGRLMVGEHRQKGLPRAHFLAELLGHNPSDLSEVREVMHDPGCQELAERYASQAGMDAGQFEGGGSQLPGAEQNKIVAAELIEFLEQGAKRATDVASAMPEAVVGLEELVGTFGQDDPGSRDPIRLLAVNQVTDDIEGTECVGTFHCPGPGSRKPV